MLHMSLFVSSPALLDILDSIKQFLELSRRVNFKVSRRLSVASLGRQNTSFVSKHLLIGQRYLDKPHLQNAIVGVNLRAKCVQLWSI